MCVHINESMCVCVCVSVTIQDLQKVQNTVYTCIYTHIIYLHTRTRTQYTFIDSSVNLVCVPSVDIDFNRTRRRELNIKDKMIITHSGGTSLIMID